MEKMEWLENHQNRFLMPTKKRSVIYVDAWKLNTFTQISYSLFPVKSCIVNFHWKLMSFFFSRVFKCHQRLIYLNVLILSVDITWKAFCMPRTLQHDSVHWWLQFSVFKEFMNWIKSDSKEKRNKITLLNSYSYSHFVADWHFLQFPVGIR